ncbi:MAG: hypothetical protein Q9187_002357 [Circinaria calcarea]
MAPPTLKFKPKPAPVRVPKEVRERRELEELERKRKREDELEREAEEKRRKEKIPFGAVKIGQEDIFSGRGQKVGEVKAPRLSGPATGALSECGQAKRRKVGDEAELEMRNILEDALADQVDRSISQDQSPIIEHDSAYYLKIFFDDCPAEYKIMLREFLKKGREQLGVSQSSTMVRKFQHFVAEEVKLSGLPADMLVHPTGTLDDPLAVMMHWPTFTTSSELSWGETGDLGSPCPLILYQKGLPTEGALWADAYLRRAKVLSQAERQKKLTPMDLWDEKVRNIHEEFTNWIFQSSLAKVWVIVGVANRISFTNRYAKQLTNFFLFCEDIRVPASIYIAEDNKIMRLIIWTHHPEAMLHPSQTAIGKECDSAWNIAGALAGIDMDSTYYQRFRREKHPNALDILIRDTIYERDGGTPRTFETLANPVILWLAREGINGKAAVEDLLKDCPNQTLTGAIHRLMTRKAGLASSKLYGNANSLIGRKNSTKVNNLLAHYNMLNHAGRREEGGSVTRHLQREADPYRGDPTEVLIWCRICKADDTKRIDKTPMYEIATGKYVAYTYRCIGCCNGIDSTHKVTNRKNCDHEPVDPAIPFVTLTTLRQAFRRASSSK